MLRQGKFLLGNITEVKAWLMQIPISRRVKTIQNHHTYLPDYTMFSGEHFDRLKSMEHDHVENRDWSEIGQHFTIFPDGMIGICRTLEKNPAGIYKNNANAVCIENIGNFDTDKDAMTRIQKHSIVHLNAILCKKFGVPIDTDGIVYHHWFDLNTGERLEGAGTTKTCPGTNFFGGNKVDDARKFFIPLVLKSYLLNDPVANVINLFYGKVIPPKLNVRKAPNKSAEIVEIIPQGTKVAVFEIKEGWYRINCLEEEWINGKFLTQIP